MVLQQVSDEAHLKSGVDWKETQAWSILEMKRYLS